MAVINATDLSSIMEHTQVKEIRELVARDNMISSRPVEISLKGAELPTTTPIVGKHKKWNINQCIENCVLLFV